jgi:alkanesulfonate monooxygenase SsuD/methylene tetrahydromethanopterin reductase-like flavin-dependent oxidoreductase (luciferase family)
MRIGFRTSPQNTDWASLDAAWAEAGRHEVFDSGWLNDHLTDPNRDRGGPSFETMTALAALAHHVPGKGVGQTVLAATFRHPAMLAKEAVTLDHLTGGRYILALGAGWHVGEHESFGIDLPPLRERFDRFEATIQLLRALFSDEARAAPGVTLDAPPYRLDGAVMEPGPVGDGGPDIWLGGQGPRGLRLAARYADGWNYASNLAGTLDGFIERRDRLRAECEAIGRDPDTLTLSVQVIIPAVGEERRAALERAIAYGRAGASEILLTTPARDGAAGIRRLATEVATPLRDAFG